MGTILLFFMFVTLPILAEAPVEPEKFVANDLAQDRRLLMEDNCEKCHLMACKVVIFGVILIMLLEDVVGDPINVNPAFTAFFVFVEMMLALSMCQVISRAFQRVDAAAE